MLWQQNDTQGYELQYKKREVATVIGPNGSENLHLSNQSAAI